MLDISRSSLAGERIVYDIDNVRDSRSLGYYTAHELAIIFHPTTLTPFLTIRILRM
jgi:hypothetical protein